MFEEYLQSLQSLKPDRKAYLESLVDYIVKHLDDDRPYYAVHGICTDGGTAGSMIRYAKPEAIIIPLDYDLLNHELARPALRDLDWKGIVDLEPFNNKPVNFWVDHHLSARGKTPNATQIRFDAFGDSGSYQLLLSNFLGPMPDHLNELAVMTRITDTAGYMTQPPISQYTKLSELEITETAGEEGRRQEEQRIYLLDDAWGSCRTLKEQLVMYNELAKSGFMGIEHALPRINAMRKERQVAVELADTLDLTADIIVISFEEDSIDKFSLLRRLQARGAKVVVTFSKTPVGIKVSLRRNRNLSEAENQIIQLNEVAEHMAGGGHPGASGGFVSSIDEGLATLQQWGNNKGLSLLHHDLN